MQNEFRIKILGFYLVAVCVMQLAIYLALTFSNGEGDWLVSYDPRLGLFYLESSLGGHEKLPTLLSWLSGLWIFSLAFLMSTGIRLVKTYIASELLLLCANVGFVVVIAPKNLSPGHGFSNGDFLVPLMVMLIYSAVPLGFAVWIETSKGKTVHSH